MLLTQSTARLGLAPKPSKSVCAHEGAHACDADAKALSSACQMYMYIYLVNSSDVMLNLDL
jgi:hypothetical protein